MISQRWGSEMGGRERERKRNAEIDHLRNYRCLLGLLDIFPLPYHFVVLSPLAQCFFNNLVFIIFLPLLYFVFVFVFVFSVSFSGFPSNVGVLLLWTSRKAIILHRWWSVTVSSKIELIRREKCSPVIKKVAKERTGKKEKKKKTTSEPVVMLCSNWIKSANQISIWARRREREREKWWNSEWVNTNTVFPSLPAIDFIFIFAVGYMHFQCLLYDIFLYDSNRKLREKKTTKKSRKKVSVSGTKRFVAARHVNRADLGEKWNWTKQQQAPKKHTHTSQTTHRASWVIN